MKKQLIIGLIMALTGILIAAISRPKIHLLKSALKPQTNWQDSLRDGDLIFQVNTAGQGKAIQLATHSQYTHIGIIFREGKQWMVYEAVEPVRKTPLDEFINHGDDGKAVIKRLNNAGLLLADSGILKMKTYAESQLNKHYDIYFGWDDDVLYCSELVWKCYHEIGITIGPLKQLKTFDLTSTTVKDIMERRYGINIPYDENVISPGDIFTTDNLITVYSN